MTDLKLPPFFIGQQVRALKAIPAAGIKVGDVRKVRDIKYYCCGTIVLDVGVTREDNTYQCSNCGQEVHLKRANKDSWYLSTKVFEGVEDEFQPTTYKEILTKEKIKVCYS